MHAEYEQQAGKVPPRGGLAGRVAALPPALRGVYARGRREIDLLHGELAEALLVACETADSEREVLARLLREARRELAGGGPPPPLPA